MKKKHLLPTVLCALSLLSCSGGLPDYDATGTFESTEVLVSAETQGRLLSLAIEEGDRLEAGQQVGCIDTVQLHLRKLQLQAGMKSVDRQRPDIRTQIAATQEQIRQADRECRRLTRLVEAGAANRKDLDDATTLLEVLNRQLAAQQSTLTNSDESLTWQFSSVAVEVAQVEDQLSKCRIRAPLSGTVLAKYAEEGELAVPGTPLFKMADLDKVYLRAYVTSHQLSRISLGQTLTVHADYGDGEHREYTGTVTWISDTAEFTPKTILTDDERANQVYAVKIAVPNDGMLKLGMYGGIYLPDET